MSSISMAIDSQCVTYDGQVRGDQDKYRPVYCGNDNKGYGYARITPSGEGDGDDDDGDGGYDYAPAA